MDEKRYLVGEVSKITGVSKDCLRFWDKIDLLKPKYVDPNNNYRYYTYDQFWSIDIITCCRSLNISIDKIREILNTSSNDLVLELLEEKKKEAEELSRYFQQVGEDIDWYVEQDKRMRHIKTVNHVTVKHFPRRMVIYSHNKEEMHAYHLKLQELCQKVVPHSTSIRRNYGFILNPKKLGDGAFEKLGEYIQFDSSVIGDVGAEYLTVLPEGDYACCTLNVINQRADFSPLLEWLAKQNKEPKYVIADEMGLQLFEYLEHGYLCEVKVLL